MEKPNRSAPAIAVAGIVGILAAAPGPATAQWQPLGPFRAGEQNPLYRLFHVPHADRADLVEPGTFRVESSVFYSNIFEQSQSRDHFQLFDMERMTTAVVVRYGPAPGWEVGGRLGVHTSWGGFLDPFISGFHDFFGFPNGNRDAFPEGEYEFLLVESRRQLRLEVPSHSPGLEDLRFFAKRRLGRREDGSSATSARATVRLASGTFAGSTGRADAAVSVLHRRSWGRAHLHLQGGVTTVNAPEVLGAVSRDLAGFISAAGEIGIVPSLSFLAQFVGGTAYVDGFGTTTLDRGPMNLVLGFAGSAGPSWRWSFSFAEDVPPNSPSADFTVGVEASRTF